MSYNIHTKKPSKVKGLALSRCQCQVSPPLGGDTMTLCFDARLAMTLVTMTLDYQFTILIFYESFMHG
jgi:hypothetical protein